MKEIAPFWRDYPAFFINFGAINHNENVMFV